MGFNPGTFQLRFGAEKVARDLQAYVCAVCESRGSGELFCNARTNDIKSLFEGLHKLGPKIVVITDGPNGAYASDGMNQLFYAALSGSEAADFAHRRGRCIFHGIFLRLDLWIVGA